MSKNRIYKGQPRFKYQTIALGRSTAMFTGLALSPEIHPREEVGGAGSAGQGADTSARCVPTSELSITQSPGRGRWQLPFNEIAIIPGIPPNQDLFLKRDSAP